MDSSWSKLFEENGQGLLFRRENQTQLNFTCLDKMYRDKILCDVVLVCEGVEIHAHKIILAISSTFFYCKFSNDRKLGLVNRIIMENISYETLYAVINYFYKSEVYITGENVEDLFTAASILALQDLQEACWDYLQANLSASNCIGIESIAMRYNNELLVSEADDYIVEHFSEVIKNDEYLQLTCDQILDLISRDVLCTTEEDILDGVIRWVRFDLRDRKDHVESLMKNVRLSLIPQKIILRRIEQEQWLRSNNEFLLQFMSSHMLQGEPRSSTTRRQPPQLLAVFGITDRCVTMAKYDFQKNQWFTVPLVVRVPVTTNTRVIVHKTRIYCIDEKEMKSVEFSKSSQITWTTYSPMSEPRGGYAAAVINNFIYVVGGDYAKKTTERFDLSSGHWKKLADMSYGRRDLGLGALNGYLYAVGGTIYNQGSYTNVVECYHPDTDTWLRLPSMAISRINPGVGALEDTLFVVGGRNTDGKVSKHVEGFNRVQSTWSRLPDMDCAREAPAVIAVNGLLYVIGGGDSSVEIYDPKSNTWSTKRMPTYVFL